MTDGDRLHTGFRDLLRDLGEDPDRPDLQRTPERVMESLRFLTRGYREDLAAEMSDGLFEEESRDLVVVRRIEFVSLCEHHMLPFLGVAHVGYLPTDRVVGISKLARVVQGFSQRLQIQEKLTAQIAQAVQDILKPKGVGVVIQSEHSCMTMRGVNTPGSLLTTSTLLGAVRDDPRTRQEFLGLVRGR